MLARPLPCLLVITALAYFSALSAGFQFDDFNVIVDNPAVHSLAAWWGGMPGIRPLLKLSYTLNWLADPGPAGFHAVNVLLHLVNVTLVWRLTGHLPLPDGEAGRRARLVATLLFALHPIQTESVTYVSGRSMTLMASFGLAGLLAWLEAADKARPRAWQALALLLLTAAILTKEVAVVLPLTLLLFRRSQPTNTPSPALPRPPPPRRVGLGERAWLPPTLFVLLALATLFALFGYQRLFAETPIRGLGENLLSELNALYYLLGQLFRPHALNIDPELPELTGWSLLSAAQFTGLAVAIAVAWLARQRRPWLMFSLFWLLILLLPTHTLIARLDLASERHLYLAALGPYWLAAVVLAGLPGRWPWRAAVASLALIGMLFTHQRNLDYRDEISLWQQTTTQSPGNARAWNNLGWAYFEAKRNDEAKLAFARAIEIDPDHEEARQNLDYLNQESP